jgi:hypothetical protein
LDPGHRRWPKAKPDSGHDLPADLTAIGNRVVILGVPPVRPAARSLKIDPIENVSEIDHPVDAGADESTDAVVSKPEMLQPGETSAPSGAAHLCQVGTGSCLDSILIHHPSTEFPG